MIVQLFLFSSKLVSMVVKFISKIYSNHETVGSLFCFKALSLAACTQKFLRSLMSAIANHTCKIENTITDLVILMCVSARV